MKKNQHRSSEIPENAWSRFERAVDVVAKSPPQHRTKTVPSKTKKHPKKAVTKQPVAK
jgi:hypothetical protein